MAPTILVQRNVTKTTTAQELQSLQELKVLITSTFSCVGYLRDLFSESCFEDDVHADISLKKIRRGASSQTDSLLDWIELGIMDAITKKYLKSIVLCIYEDQNNPEAVLETYTFHIAYPDKNDTNSIVAQVTSLSIEQYSKTAHNISNNNCQDISKSIAKILRTICLLTQTLSDLPDQKFVTLKLFYYEDTTPADYQPPGFVYASPEKDLCYSHEPLEFDFGTARTNFHNINVRLKTTCDTNQEATMSQATEQTFPTIGQFPHLATDNILQSLTPNLQPIITGISFNPYEKRPALNGNSTISQLSTIPNLEIPCQSLGEGQQLSSGSFSTQCQAPVVEITSHDNFTESNQLFTLQDSQPAVTPIVVHRENVNAEPANETDLTKCICGVYEPDLAMLFCDSCNSWSHTVCCGFFTNNDKRLPQGPYNCLTCQYRDNSATLKFLQSLAIFRRALYIIYHEGINTTGEFADRIGISIKYVRVVMRRLIQENFLEKIPFDESTLSLKKTSKFKYNVLRNPEIKKMLKLYFSSDLTIFQGFKYCIRNPNAEKCVGSFRLARNIQGISRRNESNLSEEQDGPEKEQNPKKKVKVSIVEPGIKCQ